MSVPSTASGDTCGRVLLHAADGAGVAVAVSGAAPLPTTDAPATWTATGSAVNATATATRAASVGSAHHLSAIVASFSGAATALLTIKQGATVLAEHYVVNAEVLPLPLKIAADSAVSAELAAGGVGITGKVAIVGYTVAS